MELVLSGDHVEAPRAYELGLVNRLTPTGGALDVALELALKIAANGPLAVIASKDVVRHAHGWSDEEAQQAQEAIVRAGDAQRGRAGGRPRLRREASAGVARPVSRAPQEALQIVPVAFAQVADLVAELDADLSVRYGGEGDPVHAPPAEFDGPGGQMLLATLAGAPVGCVGLRRIDERTAELKRMYVRPDARGRGIARALLAACERAADESRLRADLARDRNDAAGGRVAVPHVRV